MSDTLTMYCCKCGYPLDGLGDNRCPECGWVFQPEDAETYRSRPKRPRFDARRLAWVVPLVAASVITMPVAVIGVLGGELMIALIGAVWRYLPVALAIVLTNRSESRPKAIVAGVMLTTMYVAIIVAGSLGVGYAFICIPPMQVAGPVLCYTYRRDAGALRAGLWYGVATVTVLMTASLLIAVAVRELQWRSTQQVAGLAVSGDWAGFMKAVEEGANIHSRGISGYTGIHFAAQQGQERIVVWAVRDRGVDPNVSTDGGVTPLHLAAKHGRVSVVAALI